MVGIKSFLTSILLVLVLFCWHDTIHAAPNTIDVLNSSRMFKGFFGESLIDDIWLSTGREPFTDKINPLTHGADKIYKLKDGTFEIHEVKAYKGWAGKGAMKTTFNNGTPTFELSAEWNQNWLQKAINDPKLSTIEREKYIELDKAIKAGKCQYRYDEVNLTTRQVRFSRVIQKGNGDVELEILSGPTRIKYYDRIASKRSREFVELKAGNIEKLLQKPKMQEWTKGNPLTKADYEIICNQYNNTVAGNQYKTTVVVGLVTPEGKLLVALKTGTKAGIAVFAVDAGIATVSYIRNDINLPEFEEHVWDAVLKGSAVGSCTAVAVFLGATPGGWVVAGVGFGSYIVVDTAVQAWRNEQKRKYLNANDLKAWGLSVDSNLGIKIDSVLDIKKDSTLELKKDSTLELKNDSILDLNSYHRIPFSNRVCFYDYGSKLNALDTKRLIILICSF